MKLLRTFEEQVQKLGPLKRAWFTTFNLNIAFFERNLLPILLEADQPVNRLDYEGLQLSLTEKQMDVRLFCDIRFMDADQIKRTTVPVHGLLPKTLGGQFELFHPKVIFLEGINGQMVVGAGSANLTISGWSQNQEAFIFREVSSNEQYKQIESFFNPLLENLDILDSHKFKRRRFTNLNPEWSFAHSFQKKSFLEQLFEGIQAKQLSVWSPYFPKNLSGSSDNPGIVDKISTKFGELTYAIVPDRVNNQRIRTQWSDDLDVLIRNKTLSFHERPSLRDEKIEMTHAKLWLAKGEQTARLAIGSWNFTEPGSASFQRRNVEAGILLNVAAETKIAGIQLNLSDKAFSDESELDEDALKVAPYLLPFQLQVSFDWEQSVYSVEGCLYDETEINNSYQIRLPGINKKCKLSWKTRRSKGFYWLNNLCSKISDNEALLADHCYEVWLGKNLKFRGLIYEKRTDYRRTQGYDSLKDLLNDLVINADNETSTKQVLRGALRQDDLNDDDLETLGEVQDNNLSYFRLFQAFETLRNRLNDAESIEELEKLLFVYPGCMQELIAKINEQRSPSNSTSSELSDIFKWFLFQEGSSLYRSACGAYKKLCATSRNRALTKNEKWESLKLKKLKQSTLKELSSDKKYIQKIMKLCGYEN